MRARGCAHSRLVRRRLGRPRACSRHRHGDGSACRSRGGVTPVVVAGASGLLGSHVVAELLHAGHEVRAVDIRPGNPSPACPFLIADLTRARRSRPGAGRRRGGDPHRGDTSSDRADRREVFARTCSRRNNVTEAAKIHGARRIVNASSFSVIGWPFNVQPLRPEFLPIDESHPLSPQEAYGLSKLVTEQILAAAARCRPSLSAVNLRFPWIQTAASFDAEVVAGRRDEATRPRTSGRTSTPGTLRQRSLPRSTRPLRTSPSVYLSAPDTFMEEETLELVRRSFPGVELRRELPGHASLICSDAGERLLGFRPSRSWRSYGGGA